MFNITNDIPNEVLFLASYPSRACGIATYSKDLINALHRQFSSFSIKVCALEEDDTQRDYPTEVKYILKTNTCQNYTNLAERINKDNAIKMVFIQHEFGLFGGEYGEFLLAFLFCLKKPVSITFHTILPKPNIVREKLVQAIANFCDEIIVMTKNSAALLQNDYNIAREKISIIPHGTHMVPWMHKQSDKLDFLVDGLDNRLVLSTFGLLSSNKNIETTLNALPKIVAQFPTTLFLVLGKTHPNVIRSEGELYRESLEEKVRELNLEKHVLFVNKYLDLSELLEYLCLTDVYLFTSKDPNQAVSGTFAYAMSCKCPVISTPIPHAQEMLQNNAGIIIDFENSEQLANSAIQLLSNDELREEMGSNAFHQTRSFVWENAAIKHAKIFDKHLSKTNSLSYHLPEIKLEHIHSLTDDKGMIQFSSINVPDIDSGYTLDDNARAMIAICLHYSETKEMSDLILINTYLNFIEYCQQNNGKFLNYVDKEGEFHLQNRQTNLEDSNGRGVWALGVLIAHHHIIPKVMVEKAIIIFDKAVIALQDIDSPRSIAFIIKGLYFYNTAEVKEVIQITEKFADKLLKKYNAIADTNWKWFEEYLTYANSTLPEAMLCAHLITGNESYKMIAHTSFEFLLSHLFIRGQIKVVSNNGWHQKGSIPQQHGEQPIDVSYTIQALSLFYGVFKDESYRKKMDTAFSWFLGNNHLNQTIYNPLTGGCYDGLEEHSINLNQGAESTVCYLMARLIMEKSKETEAVKIPTLTNPKKELYYSKGLTPLQLRQRRQQIGTKVD